MVNRVGVIAVVVVLASAVVSAAGASGRVHVGGPAAVAAGFVSPYSRGMRGIDLSYPNCGQRLAGRAAFVVVGVNGGRPFTFNPCFRREYLRYARSRAVAVYLNTGYDRGFLAMVAPGCARAARGRPHWIAYSVGCSEVETSVGHLRWLGLRQPRVWWLDVETSNGWSSSRAFNTSVLHGMYDRLRSLAPGAVVGVYSLRSWWREITRGWSPSIPEWIPRVGGVACSAPFAQGPVWIAQTGSSVLDLDTAC